MKLLISTLIILSFNIFAYTTSPTEYICENYESNIVSNLKELIENIESPGYRDEYDMNYEITPFIIELRSINNEIDLYQRIKEECQSYKRGNINESIYVENEYYTFEANTYNEGYDINYTAPNLKVHPIAKSLIKAFQKNNFDTICTNELWPTVKYHVDDFLYSYTEIDSTSFRTFQYTNLKCETCFYIAKKSKIVDKLSASEFDNKCL